MRNAYPNFKLKFFLGGKLINSLRTIKSNRILFRIRLFGGKKKWDKAYLGFFYASHYHNEGVYQNSKDLEHAFRCFMELLPEFTKSK